MYIDTGSLPEVYVYTIKPVISN